MPVILVSNFYEFHVYPFFVDRGMIIANLRVKNNNIQYNDMLCITKNG